MSSEGERAPDSAGPAWADGAGIRSLSQGSPAWNVGRSTDEGVAPLGVGTRRSPVAPASGRSRRRGAVGVGTRRSPGSARGCPGVGSKPGLHQASPSLGALAMASRRGLRVRAVALVTTPAGISGAVLLLPVQVSVLGVPSPAVTPTNLLYNARPGATIQASRGRLVLSASQGRP